MTIIGDEFDDPAADCVLWGKDDKGEGLAIWQDRTYSVYMYKVHGPEVSLWLNP